MTPKEEFEASAMGQGLRKMREPFPDHQISKLPKGGTTLSYVGHAALTDRLLDADPMWQWEPLAFTADGLPRFDETGGLWIKLTVCGVTRLGYGHAKAKAAGPNNEPGTREKEVIGDALRNAGMRFGAALDLWHKGELHADREEQQFQTRPLVMTPPAPPDGEPGSATNPHPTPEDDAIALLAKFDGATTLEQVDAINEEFKKAWPRIKGVKGLQDSMVALRANARARLKTRPKAKQPVGDDDIPF